MENFLVLCLSLSVVFGLTCAEPNKYRIVNANSGRVRGIRETSILKSIDFYSFKGIQYAKTPTGDLRFKVSTFQSSVHLKYIRTLDTFKAPEPAKIAYF